MTRSLVIGSGPAAAGAALALALDPSRQITVLDVGHHLEDDRRTVLSRLSAQPPSAWRDGDVDAIRAQPSGRHARGLPQKRAYGSDFPFRDAGQLDGVSAEGRANRSVISGAYGGLSTVWGAQVMPYTAASFDRWPVAWGEMEPHYRAVLAHLPFAAEPDALEERFPLLVEASPLPPLAARSVAVVDAAERHRSALGRAGVTVGRARLAFDSGSCVRCGLCMTGCPYSLIYSSAQTFDRLLREGRIEYRDGLLAVEVGEDDSPFVIVRDLRTGGHHRLDADRVFVACGAIGTTRLVLSSLEVFDEEVELGESAQFVAPMLSFRPVPDPRRDSEFTLNQFNMVVSLDDRGADTSQIHFYPHNPAVTDALPAPFATRAGEPLTRHLVRRLTVGLGYLPSWESPSLRVKVVRRAGAEGLPATVISGDERHAWGNRMLRRVVRRMVRAAPFLDLWPAVPMISLSGPGYSYHFGGSFPHRLGPGDGPLTTDRLGRLRFWPRVHLVDASVFPAVSATTFTLTVMANAHRIASETLADES
jgi:choline dehydrogenase-like flavoprotein